MECGCLPCLGACRGAALPTNTPGVPCIFDPLGRAGICGDWLLGSSLEASALSGMALADHVSVHCCWISLGLLIFVDSLSALHLGGFGGKGMGGSILLGNAHVVIFNRSIVLLKQLGDWNWRSAPFQNGPTAMILIVKNNKNSPIETGSLVWHSTVLSFLRGLSNYFLVMTGTLMLSLIYWKLRIPLEKCV